MPRRLLAALLAGLATARAFAAVPPVPVPPENPITEPKRVLGKILFWDEQLSSDGSVACGTCHRPAFGGADPRAGRYPGVDKGTIDDVRGSPGHREPRPRRASRARPGVRGPAAGHSASRAVELRRALGRRAVLGRPRALAVQGSADRRDGDRARRRAREPGGRRARDVHGDGEARSVVGRRDRRHRARDAARARDEPAERRGRRARAARRPTRSCSRRRSATPRSRPSGSRSRSQPTSARS